MAFTTVSIDIVIIGLIIGLLIGMLLIGILLADQKNRFLSLLLCILALSFVAMILLPIQFMPVLLIIICSSLIIIIYRVGIPRFKTDPDKFLIDKIPQVWEQFTRPPESKEEST